MAKRNETGGRRTKINATEPPAAAKRAKPKGNGYQLPDKLPEGEILTDAYKKHWRLGWSIGIGGFGEIYSASDNIAKPVTDNAEFVVKIEPHENGPLFTETHFYLRAGKPEMIEKYRSEKKMKFLGMPQMCGFGSHMYGDVKYRFMVMDRFGVDLQRVFEANKKKFTVKNVFSIAIKLIDVLEYIHSTGYVHADIKASNLLLGFKNENEIFLVDFGLACKYMTDDKHKVYEEDPRKAHDGTIEFTSRDAHVGAHSRRGDMEILAYNIVQWLCGQLPWEKSLKDPVRVHEEKKNFMKNIGKSLKTCFGDEPVPDGVEAYCKYVSGLTFEQQPNYNACRKLFINGLKKSGLKEDGRFDLKNAAIVQRKVMKSKSPVHANGHPPVKKPKNEIEPVLKQNGESSTKSTSKSKKTKASESLSKNKTKSKISNSLESLLPPGEVPTPAMLMVMQMKEKQMQTKLKKPIKKISPKNKKKPVKAHSDSEDSTVEEYFTPPTSRSLRSRKRASSLSFNLNDSHTPELF